MLAGSAIAVGALAFLIFSMVRSIRNERTPGRSIWRDFGLGIALVVLFFASWIGQAIAEWQTFTDEQHAHGEVATAGDFVAQFSQSTFENWQSEFLQLFAFVSLAALYVHKGSAESKDSEDRMEAALVRIEKHLGSYPQAPPRREQLPDFDES
jgi:hypothetical protein